MLKTVILLLVICPQIVSAQSLQHALNSSAEGMHAQSERMKVLAQNIANANSTGTTPGSLPYRRKTITFKNRPNPKYGHDTVQVYKLGKDYKTNFKARFDPSHPAANAEGYVLLPNVSSSIETVDMKEAERGYEANLSAIETSKRMYFSTIDLLR